MGCAREGGLVTAWAAAFLHCTHKGCEAASPHTGAVTALHEPKAVPGRDALQLEPQLLLASEKFSQRSS